MIIKRKMLYLGKEIVEFDEHIPDFESEREKLENRLYGEYGGCDIDYMNLDHTEIKSLIEKLKVHDAIEK